MTTEHRLGGISTIDAEPPRRRSRNAYRDWLTAA
ncbi:hypothetical protein QBC98_005719 [Kitasatospora acidiphila]